ncbi:radical SAM protein [Caballeronia sp. GAFFF3]|uniref:radical SAM protein n=1 Tax=Caballeronia sp. GAFFF3 TaxID=2921759 RepID=UPI00254104FD|nr:radical SAM protein [Caballeronia sp. GAFFF3]
MHGLSIHLTDLCNSRCSFCVVGSPMYAKDTIDFAEVQHFLIRNSSPDVEFLNLHGGEATIHPRLSEILELTCELAIPEVHLQTNGIRLADVDFTQKLWDKNVKLFIISLHGDTSILQDSQTGTSGGFRKTIAGIRNAKMVGARVRTNTVVTLQNISKLSAIAELAVSLGVDHVNFSNLHPVGSATFAFEALVPRLSSIARHLYAAAEIVQGAGKKLTIEGFPYCTVPELRELQLNENPRQILMLMRGHVIEDYDKFMSSQCRVFGPPCGSCSHRSKCGGAYPEYVSRIGWSEFHGSVS